MTYKHFSDDEVAGLQPAFVARLDRAREAAGVAFIITPGGGLRVEGTSKVQGSAHEAGWAVDLRCSSSHQRFLILRALFAEGFTRVGVYHKHPGGTRPGHVHVDDDPTKPAEVTWTGVSS